MSPYQRDRARLLAVREARRLADGPLLAAESAKRALETELWRAAGCPRSDFSPKLAAAALSRDWDFRALRTLSGRVAFRFGRNRDDRDELADMAFVAALEVLACRPSANLAYLGVAMRNRLLQEARRRQIEIPYDPIWLEAA